MAVKKKVQVESAGKQIDIFKTLKKIDNDIEIIEDSTISNIRDWIPTGNYILNACLSGDLFKGIPTGRVTTIAGPSQTGKSYLAVSICREAQKMGYTPVYLDSEGGMDKDFVSRLGCNPNDFLIKEVNTLKETTTFIANMCESLMAQVKDGAEPPKIILVLDSLGNLTSDKEKADALSGNSAADFTKAKDTKAMFRVITQPLSKLQIPMVCINHVYASIGSFVGGFTMAQGSGIQYAGSVTLTLASIAKLQDKENDKNASKGVGAESVKKNGVLITAWPDKSRFCIPHKIKFQIPYYKAPNPYIGLEEYLNWDNAGIMQGKCFTQDEYDKLPESDKDECEEFDFNGEKRYALPKKVLLKGVGIVCKHLGKAVSPVEFYSPEVFTDEFLHKINDEIIKPAFQLPDRNSLDDIKDIEDSINIGSGSEENSASEKEE